ncbi:adenine nucleotide translocase lysine N-methyltransferase isoform X2 [Tachyglossus aculeatus]|uniref:adenine nucleotide translocase lysine N-methyltransferase isoform X2 n=1 Tax=Tachyglossus aculeatus TaxID=9261 RepID=UPI0018F48D2E|nr:adenine nucleotide translocase lysine N-methyltransferase isoform X2 [Tachyglossus aculeatus]
MDPDEPDEALAELRRGRRLGGAGLLQLAAGTGLAAYAVWAGLLMPGFRRVPLRLQVPYAPAGARQVDNVLTLLRGRSGKVLEASRRGFHPAVGYELNPWLLRLARFHAWRARRRAPAVAFHREDLWRANLSDCTNVTVFLAPSVLPLLEAKLLAELPDRARVVAGRFPLPTWAPSAVAGEGADRAWAYDLHRVRRLRDPRSAQAPRPLCEEGETCGP